MNYSSYEEVLKQKNQLESIIRITERIHSFTDIQDVYNAVVDSALELKNIDMVMIYLVDEERKEAVLKAQRGVSEDYLRRASRIPYPKGVTWKVINTGKILNIPDAQQDPDIGPAGRDLGHHGVLGVPIFFEGKVIGVIWFLSYKEQKFSEDEVEFFSTLGKQIAIAISKSKMIEDLRALYNSLDSTKEQLIHAEKMAALGRLTSSIAHEINNPLTPIIGYTELLLAQPNIDEEKKRRYLEFVYESARRIDRIVKGLLSYCKNDNKVEMQSVDVNLIVDRVLKFREYQLNLNDISVIKDLDLNIPQVKANPTQLEQVFVNIVLNAEQALKSIDRDRQLVVRTRALSEERVEVSFSDNGPGISKEVIGKIFEPFYTTKSGEGTGLGLFIVYEIIKRHNGKVWVESEERKGTKFTVELPSIRQSDIGFGADKERGCGGEFQAMGYAMGKKRILVVEDEELIAEMVKSVLEEGGFEVDVASGGKKALEKLEEDLYDLIICDVKMPCMDGNRFYHEVRERYNMSEDRFIFITGDLKALSSDIDRSRVLKKPFTVEELKMVVRKLL